MAASDGAVYAFHSDGLPAAGWPQTTQEGNRPDAGVTLADVTGDGVPEVIAGYWRGSERSLRETPEAAAAFLIGGERAPRVGEIMKEPLLAASLKLIAET